MGLGSRPLGVKLVGEVGHHQPPRLRPATVVARLIWGEVPALASALGTRQRGLDEQQISFARKPDEVLVGRAVGTVGEPGAVAVRYLYRERPCVMGNLAEAQPQRAQLEPVGPVVLV